MTNAWIGSLNAAAFRLLAQAGGGGDDAVEPPLDLGRGVDFLGVNWIGVNADNGRKLLITVLFVVVTSLVAYGINRAITAAFGTHPERRLWFWLKQATHLIAAAILLLGVLSIWFDDPQRLATAFGLVAAGLAFALQKVVTGIAGYFVILRGSIFGIGDRIAMGGVRGDVIALGFTQTTIMEMGQPPSVQAATPEIWVRSRQYTGRIVSVPNGKIFDEPVFNYSRDFGYIWEEMTLPISYDDDRKRAEEILLSTVNRHRPDVDKMKEDDLADLRRRYPVDNADLTPTVYYRLTDNWLELSVRFVTAEHGVRGLKDRISRDLVDELDAAGIGIASATSEIVGLPPVEIVDRREQPSAAAS